MPKQHPGLFADLGKRSNDLLSKEFPSENKLSWKGQPNRETTLETSILQKKDGSIIGAFAPKYNLREWGTTVSAEVNTRKEVKVEAVSEDLLSVDGLKTTLTGYSKGNENYGEVGVEYKHEMATVTASVDYGKANGSTVKASAVIGAQGIALGAKTEYFFGGESELKDLTTIVSYGSPEFDLTAFGRIQSVNDEDKNELGASYFHRINADWQVGAEAVFETANTDAKPKLTFGTQYVLNPDSVLKAKFDTAGKLGLSLQQRWNRNAKLTLASNIDTNNLGGKNAANIAFTLSLND